MPGVRVPMRLCLFTPVFLPYIGGAEVAMDALARQFGDLGHHVVVLAKGKPAVLGVPYPVRWASRPRAERFFPERIAKPLVNLHHREHFDLIFSPYTHPTGHAAVMVADQLHVPVVIGSQGGDLYHSSKHRARAHLWKRTIHACRHADGLVAISPHMEQLIREICPEPRRLAQIPNGVDLEQYTAPSTRPHDFQDQRPFVLCLGNIGPMKGFDHAVEAFAKVRRQMEGTALVIVGDGPLRGKIERLVKDHQLESDVLLPGTRHGAEKRWFLQHCRFGLMPSIEEGLPLVALEFMASARPLICTTNASFDGLVEEGQNGHRVPAGQPTELAEALLRMNGADLQSMGAEGQRRVADYDWARIAPRYIEFFEQVCRSRG